MKKTYIQITVLLLFVGILTGCSDSFLENMKPHDQFDESIFESETQTNWYIDGVYYRFYDALNSPDKSLVGSFSSYTNRTEEAGGITDWTNVEKKLDNADDNPNYFGTKLQASMQNNSYTRIRDCNFLIERIDVVGGNSLSEEFRKAAKGQMYFLRAVQYFDLLRTYGGVPYITEVLDANANDESIKIPRMKSSELFKKIAEDLQTAADFLEGNAWSAKTDYGRVTREAALAMKSRVLLTAASPLFNKDWDNTASPLWEDALQASLTAEKELKSKGYGLYGSSAKDWEEMFTKTEFTSEAIFVRLLSNEDRNGVVNNQWENSIRPKSQGGNGPKDAPKEMIDLFPLANGLRPTAENGYDDEKFFLNRDPRFYRTFAFSGSCWGYKEDSEATIWAYRYNNNDFADNNTTKSPAFVRKMTDIKISKDNFPYSGNPILEFRYAELILNIAECYAAQGKLDKALEYLKEIRKRVGIPSQNNYGIGVFADKYEALEACLYERRVELAYEGKRYWDIQRWMLYEDDSELAANNTCKKLGLEPIKGTQRTGHNWKVKQTTSNSDDPLLEERKAISVNPDSENFEDQLKALADFYDNNFERVDPQEAMDHINGRPTTINWNFNYYLHGLRREVLSNNNWIEQTIGWKDAYGSFGTYDPRD